jgi:hypothetical protein
MILMVFFDWISITFKVLGFYNIDLDRWNEKR